jgi:hypothetical protein
MSEKRWQPGDTVMLRDVGNFSGILWCWPHIVVQDTDDLLALYEPEGSMIHRWRMDEGVFGPPAPVRMDFLRLMFPGKGYAVLLVFDAGTGVAPWYAEHFDGDARFRGWKVNLESPFRRTELGFDTTDEFLDLIVRPDGSWYWKDEEHVVPWVERGAYTHADVEQIRRAGREAEKLIAARTFPFNDHFVDWRPGAAYEMPLEIEGWHELPGRETTLTHGRRYDFWKKA